MVRGVLCKEINKASVFAGYGVSPDHVRKEQCGGQ